MPNKKLIVIKVGSNTLTDAQGRLDLNNMRSITEQLAALHKDGYNVILVTSAAIAAGIERLNLDGKIKTVPEKQAAAAVGQTLLLNEYNCFFEPHGISIGQILMTADEIKNPKKAANLKNTFYTLLQLKVIPIVNENDSVAVDEIKVGDNDTLSAHVAMLTKAKLLILLTDSDGLHTDNPHKNKNAELISEVDVVNDKIERLAGKDTSSTGTGGMYTKVQAARLVTTAGIPMYIGNGRTKDVVLKIVHGEKIGTHFKPH